MSFCCVMYSSVTRFPNSSCCVGWCASCSAAQAGTFSINKFQIDLKSQGIAVRKDTLHSYLIHLDGHEELIRICAGVDHPETFVREIRALLMQLPTDLEQRLLQEVYTLERNVSMPYVTSAERFGIEKGRQEGRQEGEAALLKRLLARRFGALPDAVQVRLTTADVDQLEEWAIKVLDAESLDEVFDQRPQ